MAKITKKEYEAAKLIVLKYEEQNKKTFTKGQFTADDLTLLWKSISVERLTIDIFTEDDCYKLEGLINERISGLEWVNVDDSGYLSISFIHAGTPTEEQIKAVLDSLNEI